MTSQGSCARPHPPVHLLRAELVSLWTGGIVRSLAFIKGVHPKRIERGASAVPAKTLMKLTLSRLESLLMTACDDLRGSMEASEYWRC
jgi:hypothetical protein